MKIESNMSEPLMSVVQGMAKSYKVINYRFKIGDYVTYSEYGGFIIGRIIKLGTVELGGDRYESYTITVVGNNKDKKYARIFSFGGQCVNKAKKISELKAVTLGL